MLDFVIQGALIVDGTGAEPRRHDLGVKNGKIAGIGENLGEAERVISAEGLVLCPGFIDMHTHMDLELLRDNKPDAKIRQGVTTDLLGQDGLGTAPAHGKNKKLLMDILWGSTASFQKRSGAGVPSENTSKPLTAAVFRTMPPYS